MASSNLQEEFYSADSDYSLGGPHLSHLPLRAGLSEILRRSVLHLRTQGLPLTVLEIGAGHGGYTEAALALGCEVTAVEMSRPSVDALHARFGTNNALRAVYDPDGNLRTVDGRFSLLLAVSVLHHIPDYQSFLRSAVRRLNPGGGVLTLQDPLWYARMPVAQHRSDRAAYLLWRLGRGNLRAGAASLRRRLTGRLDESMPGDMVEYHVVRQGVDEDRVVAELHERFRHTELIRYWSNQSRAAQRLGDRLGWANTFAVIARGYAE